MYRQFWLINGKGDKFSMNDSNSKIFMQSASGLGLNKSVSGIQLGNVTKVISSSYNLPVVEGELLFYKSVDNAYEDYFNFVKFISLEPIYLFYLPPNTLNPYFTKVEVVSATKTEYSTDGCMHIGISFECLTHWYNSTERVIELENTSVGDGKYYDLERDYYYGGNTLSNISLQNDGSDECGFSLEIDGDVTNPQWTIYQNGQVYGSAKIIGTYDYVKVNSKDSEQNIYLELNGSTITNPASYQDLSLSGGVLTFIKLKTGQSTMVFTCGNIDTFDGTITIRYNESYVSV